MIQDKEFYKGLNTAEGAEPLTIEVDKGIYLNTAKNIRLVPAGGVQRTLQPVIKPDPKDPAKEIVGPIMTFIATEDLEVDGTVEGSRYGFVLDGIHRGMTFKFDAGSYNVKIRRVKAINSSFASFVIKNEKQTRGGQYVIIEDCWSVGAEGESLYLGTSKTTWPDPATGEPLLAGMVDRLEIYKFTGEDSGWDHLQIKQAKSYYVGNCLFLNAATAQWPNQKYAIMVGRNNEGLIENTIFSKAPDISHLHRDSQLITFRSCLFDEWGKGIYSETDLVVFEDCDFKDMALSSDANSAVFMRGNILLNNCRIDIALKDKLRVANNNMLNLKLENCQFVDLPKVEFARTWEGEPCVKPGSHYWQEGIGKIFHTSEVDMGTVVKEPEPAREQASISELEAKKAYSTWKRYMEQE